MKDEEEVTQVVRSWAVQEQPVGDEQNHLNHVIHVYHVNDRDSRVSRDSRDSRDSMKDG